MKKELMPYVVGGTLAILVTRDIWVTVCVSLIVFVLSWWEESLIADAEKVIEKQNQRILHLSEKLTERAKEPTKE